MNEADNKVSRYWIENLSKLEGVLSGGTVYMDLVRKKKKRVYQLTVSSYPFSNETPEEYGNWRNNNVVVFEVSFDSKKKSDTDIYDIWEAHSLAAILTVSGYEIQIGNNPCEVSTFIRNTHRKSDLSSGSMEDWKKSAKGEKAESDYYSDYTETLCIKRREYEISGEMVDKETVIAVGDYPVERSIGSEGNESLLEEGM